jgi:oligogalacturonide lyase
MKARMLFCFTVVGLLVLTTAHAQIGRRFPSEKRIVPDPVTGVPLTFLTSTSAGDTKIYQTHNQWTSDGKWVIFRSRRVPGQAMAVNEESGVIVQVTESGYSGMLCVAGHSMRLYFLRSQQRGPAQIIKVDLATLFADSEADQLKGASAYETVCGTIPVEMGAGGDMALDPTEEFAYFRVSREAAARHLAPGTKLEPSFGPRSMGAGPGGLASMNLKTGKVKFIVALPFQIGHVQTNPWMPGEIVFCWETGGKAPQRTWTVRSDGSDLRPLYPEAPYEWVTHEAVISRDEVAIAIMGNRRPGAGKEPPDGWGRSGSGEHPSGVGIVNLRTREMRIAGQVPIGDPGRSVWHVHGSPDGRWAVADDFLYRLWIIDRKSGEMALLADLGRKTRAADHIHPTFNADSSKIEIQTAMLSEDGRSLNICIVPVPPAWLARSYSDRIVQ